MEENDKAHEAEKEELTNKFKTIMKKYQEEKTKNDEFQNKQESMDTGSDNKNESRPTEEYKCNKCDFKSIWKTQRNDHMEKNKCNKTKKPRNK